MKILIAIALLTTSVSFADKKDSKLFERVDCGKIKDIEIQDLRKALSDGSNWYLPSICDLFDEPRWKKIIMSKNITSKDMEFVNKKFCAEGEKIDVDKNEFCPPREPFHCPVCWVDSMESIYGKDFLNNPQYIEGQKKAEDSRRKDLKLREEIIIKILKK